MAVTFTSFEERHIISAQLPGNGVATLAGYHSESVDLRQSITTEQGSVTFAIDPAVNIQTQIRDRNGAEVTFTIIDQDPEKKECDCDICAVAHIPIPDSTADADIPTYVATQVQNHTLFPGAIGVQSQAAGTLVYSAVNPGFKIEFSSNDLQVTQTRTVEASYGVSNYVGDGSALFYSAYGYNNQGFSSNGVNTIARMPVVITGTTVVTPAPMFFGVLRKKHDPIDPWVKCGCAPRYSECYEAFTEAPGVQIPLEVPIAAVPPVAPQVFARYFPDTAINGGRTGGFQILEQGSAPPNGMIAIPAQVLYYNGLSSAVVRLARL